MSHHGQRGPEQHPVGREVRLQPFRGTLRPVELQGSLRCPDHGGSSPQAKRKARERPTEIAAYRTLGAWLSSPAAAEYAEYQDRAALAGDRAASRGARRAPRLTPAHGIASGSRIGAPLRPVP